MGQIFLLRLVSIYCDIILVNIQGKCGFQYITEKLKILTTRLKNKVISCKPLGGKLYRL